MECDVWIKTTCGVGTCVEVMHTSDDKFHVRDSKNPANELVFTAVEWNAFIKSVKNREFDVSELG